MFYRSEKRGQVHFSQTPVVIPPSVIQNHHITRVDSDRHRFGPAVMRVEVQDQKRHTFGQRQLKLSKDYYVAECLPELRQRVLEAFGALDAPATLLGVAWIPPGAYDKSHYHDVDAIVVALSKRNETGRLEIKKGGRWVGVPYDIGEAVLIPKYVEHRVKPTTIDRMTATISILN